MSALQRNAAARDALTTLFGGRGGKRKPSPPMTASEASDYLFGHAYKQPGMPTKEDCIGLLDRIWKERGHLEGEAVLSRFGVLKFSDLFMGMYQSFYRYAHAVLTYGACPFYGWDVDAIPAKVRDRWLLWHPESESLFEERKRMTDDELDRLFDQGVADVTGMDEYEKRFAEIREGGLK